MARAANRRYTDDLMESREHPPPAMPQTLFTTPTRRFVLAWIVMVGGPVGFWCCRPVLGTRAFNYGQLAVLLVTWKIASLLCLPPAAWRASRRSGCSPIASGSGCSRSSFSRVNKRPPVRPCRQFAASSRTY